MTNSPPIPDAAAARILGNALRDLRYSEETFSDLLGDDEGGDGEDAVVADRRLPRTQLGTVIRALYLQLPVPTKTLVPALGREGVDALERTGLADVGDEVVARVRILPIGPLLVASDDFPKGDQENPPDYVAAYTPTSRLCDSLTPRRRVGRAVDVGTGSGVQALLAARHARRVVATDVNRRALAYAELNAALNGVTNIEFRQGSLFEPVDGERFDLITCNAPYVVSPENRWAYRDAGFEGDEISERVVHEAAEHLADGGFATLLVSWIAADEDEPDDRPLRWTETLDCDSWILPVWGSDALAHAATWNDHLAEDPETFGEVLDTWTQYLARLRARWVSEGAIVLRRRGGRRHSTRVDLVDDDLLGPAGDQVERAFAARARLGELRRKTDLLDARLAVATPLRLEHDIVLRQGRPALDGACLELAEGTGSTVEGPARALDVASRLDGNESLGEVIRDAARALALSEAEAVKFRREVLSVSEELLELGALSFS